MRSKNRSTSPSVPAKTPAVSPKMVSLALSIPSSRESTGVTATKGTNSSFSQIQVSSGAVTTVGWTKFPRSRSPSVTTSPPEMISPPASFTASTADRKRPTASWSMTGPTNVSRSRGSPTPSSPVLSASRLTNSW